MPEQLSQSQIDALLQKMSSGGEVDVQEDTHKVREYDFKSPKKFTKEQLKSLDSLHETFSRMLSSYFSGLLRTVCEIEVTQVTEERYYEYNNALSDMALIGLVGVKPENKKYDDTTMVIDLSTAIGFYIIDRVLGGPGTGFNLSRNYTEIEISILTSVFQKIVQRLQDALSNRLPVTATCDALETNARLLQVYAPEDIVVIVMMNIKLSNRLEGPMNICISAEFLEKVIDTFSLRFAKPSKKQNRSEEEIKKRVILENVCESDMEIRAVFDEFKLELKDIMQLQLNDIITLNKPIDSNVMVTVEKIPWFTAKLGEVKQRKAIKLQDILINGDEGAQWEKSETSN